MSGFFRRNVLSYACVDNRIGWMKEAHMGKDKDKGKGKDKDKKKKKKDKKKEAES